MDPLPTRQQFDKNFGDAITALQSIKRHTQSFRHHGAAELEREVKGMIDRLDLYRAYADQFYEYEQLVLRRDQ